MIFSVFGTEFTSGMTILSAAPADIWRIVGVCALALLLFHLVMLIPMYIVASRIVFNCNMRRKNRDMWSRECSAPDPEQVVMYETGISWAEQHAEKRKSLHIVNEGLNLYAEYYDFGYDRAVIIIPGRTEGLRYSYYFAKPYAERGYNVLTVDQRAHGESDGTYNCIGFDEHRDILRWGELLHEELGVRSILLHGICIGAACGLYALLSERCPDYFAGLVAEGMYPNFYESFKNHMIERRKPTFVMMDMINGWMKHCTGHDMRVGPIDRIGAYQKPLLMLHGRCDLYSLPSEAERLYAAAGSGEKRLVWFDRGLHSRLRINDPEGYDGAIADFIDTVIDAKKTEKV